MDDKQKLLLEVVQRWNPNPNPEYRGFRCANCQKYNLQNEAYHHLLNSGGFLNPVHFCNECEAKFNNSSLEIIGPKFEADRAKFNPPSDEIRKIISRWPKDSQAVKKQIECDYCGNPLQEAYHAWFNMDGTLIELHFDKDCAFKLLI